MIINKKITPGTEKSVPSNSTGIFSGTDDKVYLKKSNGISFSFIYQFPLNYPIIYININLNSL